MIWVAFAVNLLIAMALIGAGAVPVRRAAKSAGLMLIGAGVLELVGVCCVQGIRIGTEGDVGETAIRLAQLGMLTATAVDVLVVGLVLAALWQLARHLPR